jgi:hypothetical protein
MTIRTQEDRLKRVSEWELEFPNRWGIPTRVFANGEIPLERVAVDELESVLHIQETVNVLRHKAPQFDGDWLQGGRGEVEVAAVAGCFAPSVFYGRARFL